VARQYLAAASNSNYAIFAGGYYSYSEDWWTTHTYYYDTVDAYYPV
jgi:hypothetical protein